MARGKGKKSRGGRSKPSLISMVPIGVVAANIYQGYVDTGKFDKALLYGASTVVPYNFGTNQFDMGRFSGFAISLAGTYAAKKLVGMSGVNRAMKGLPFRL